VSTGLPIAGRAQMPRMHIPTVGRVWCRSYLSRAAAFEYEDGWRHPEKYEPSNYGTPAQAGALDKILETS
jgi:hypothetical protein